MKKYMFFVLISTTIYSQDLQNNQNLDSLADVFSLEEVTVRALRAQKDTPVPFINISKKDLERVNLAQDLPTLLKNTPSVLTTSDSGSGIGYSSIRVRGSDQSRVNVTINGIPYNDSESMSVYWVNLPDFASSIESIQIQRGVGTSTNGSAAFGGSINILTNAASENASFEINNSLGSFNKVKNSVGFSTGFINDKFEKEAGKRSTDKGKAAQYAKRDEILKFFSEKNKKNLKLVFDLQNFIVDSKLIIINKLNSLNKIGTFVKTKSGFKVTNPEGFVAIDRMEGGAVKLVDRMEFSTNNFSKDIIKGWDNPN